MLIRVTGAWISLLLDWLDQQRLPAPALRAAVLQRVADDVVPVEFWRDCLEQAVALRPAQPAPELSIGACIQPRHVGVLGYLVLATHTLGEAMWAYKRYEKLFYGLDVAEMVSDGEHAELRWPKHLTGGLGQRADGAAIAAMLSFLRRQLPELPPPTSVHFIGQADADAQAAYSGFFRCPVHFGDDHVRVRYPVALLAQPMPLRDPALKAILDRQAQALLETLPDTDPMDAALRSALPRFLTEGEARLEVIAAALHRSPRTLQRRLAERGLTWQQFLDQARARLALDYLADAGLSLSDVALLLGFSEQSAFTRAFKRWYQRTPGAFRRARQLRP